MLTFFEKKNNPKFEVLNWWQHFVSKLAIYQLCQSMPGTGQRQAGTSRDKHGQGRDKQGQGRDKQGQTGTKRVSSFLSLLVPLSLSVPVFPCLSLSALSDPV